MPTAFELGPEAEELMAAAERLGRTELAPAVRDHERDARWPPRVLDVLRDISLGGLDLPERLGGAGAGCVVKVAVLETLAACDPGGLPAADQPGPAAGAFVACPDEEVAVEIAAACLAGSAQVALAVAAEPAEAPARIEWVPAWPPLTRVWLAAGDKLRLVAVDASSDSDEPALAFQASGTGSVDLGSGRELGAWSLPSGQGLAIRGRARLSSAAVALGVARAALDATIAYTTERVVFGRPVAHHQGNAFELAAAAARLDGARLCVRDAAARYDEDDRDAGFWATQAWAETMDIAFVVTDLGIQLLGGHGFLMDHLAEKRFREARMLALLHGGRYAAEVDLAAAVLEVGDPFLSAAAAPAAAAPAPGPGPG